MANLQRENGLLSPAASETSTALPNISDTLPVPRSYPLPPGSKKEITLVNFVDARILNIERRYGKSFAVEHSDQELQSGYTSFSQIIVDINAVLDVVWISATPSIQVPCILVLAGHFRGYMHSFPFVTMSFTLARKLDLAFSRLLLASTEDQIPLHAINTTDKVRIRSLAQETRFEMVEVAAKSGHLVDMEDDDDETEPDTDTMDNEEGTSDHPVALSLGKVYEKTLQILGGELGLLPPPEPDHDPTTPRYTDDVEIIHL